MNDTEITAAREYLADLQERLGAAFAAEDGAAFVAEEWQSALGKGRGLRRENGAVFERAGINFSDIAGDSLPPAATARRPHLAGESYCAAGVSLVAHPQNPYCPRRAHECAIFSPPAVRDGAAAEWILRRITDLQTTAVIFMQHAKTALDDIDVALYPKFKKQCDDYFYIKHRGEMRGIGGVFF